MEPSGTTSGSTWILLRGLTQEQRHWGDFPRLLEEALPEARVLTLDLPGNGVFNALPSPTHIEAMVAHCREELVRLEVPPPYHLLAESMGGMVSAAWAQARPLDIAGCVLINTSFGHFSPMHHRLRLRSWPAFLGIFLARGPEARERRIRALISGRPLEHPEALGAWTAIRKDRPVRLGNVLRQLLACIRYRAPGQASVPTLLLLGARDRMVDPRCSEVIARRWHCALAVHPEAGHDLSLDDGPWIIRQIQAWLQGAPPEGGMVGSQESQPVHEVPSAAGGTSPAGPSQNQRA